MISTILRLLIVFYLVYIALAILVITTLAVVFMVDIFIESRRKGRGNGHGLQHRKDRL